MSRAHLPDALRTLTERWAQDEGMRAQLEVTGTQEPLSPAIEVSLFRDRDAHPRAGDRRSRAPADRVRRRWAVRDGLAVTAIVVERSG
ncbi:hypothetical protein [Streptomyces sp. NPDC002913]